MYDTYVCTYVGAAEINFPGLSHGSKSTPHVIRIERIAKEPVDENHPDVIALVKAGYPEKQSIEAIAKYGKLEVALDHMADSSDDEDEEDEMELIPSTMRQFSREDSLSHMEMKW